MDVLSVEGLKKCYPAFELRNISFSVRNGEIMGFIGRNGAGKTTTLKSLLNFVHPDSGLIQFFGLPFLENELAIKQRIAFVSGGVDYYMRSKLHTITAATRRFYSNWDDAAYHRYLKAFVLDENKTPSQLSAGMKVKYSLALALSHHAELLLLDEPTSGLDPVSRSELLDIFLSLAKDGVSILFSTHITSDLDQCADRITYIRAGEIVASEELDTFTKRYRLVSYTTEQVTSSLRPLLIGEKTAKHGYTALLRTEDLSLVSIATTPADLETIMVHLEKEMAL